jgi:hypothetical protein
MSGYIQIGRELQNHWLRRDKDYWMVFCEMYFVARFSDKPEKRTIEGIEVTIHQKEFIFGRPAWCRRLDISDQRLKTLIKKLVAEGFIRRTQKFNKFTVYAFEYAPSTNQQNNQQSNQQDFSDQPAEQPAEQPKKEKSIKEEGIKEECLKPIGGKRCLKYPRLKLRKAGSIRLNSMTRFGLNKRSTKNL